MTQNPLNFLTKNPVLFKIFLFSIFAKIGFAYFLPLAGDEAYYWFWGQNLQLSYFDHPPAVAWMTVVSDFFYKLLPTQFMGLSLRLPFILLSTLTFIIWIKNYTLENKDLGGLVFFAALYLLNPLLGIGSIFATPDVPLLFFWALSYLAILKIRSTQNSFWFIFLGITLGLGFCSKYHIVLFPLSVLVALIFLKELKLLQSKKLFLTFIFGLIFCAPVLIWNSQNDWVSFSFQLNHGLNAPKAYNWKWTVGYFLAQSLIFNPLVLFYLIKHVRNSFSKNMAFTQFAFFVYSSFKAVVEGNWTITAHAQALVAIDKNFKRYLKWSLAFAGFFWGSLIIFFLTPGGMKKFDQFPQSSMATQIHLATKDFRPLYGPTYQMSSLLHFVSQEPIYKLKDLSRTDFYDSLKSSIPTEKFFYVLKYTDSDWPQWTQTYTKELLSNDRLSMLNSYELELYRVFHE